MIKMVLMLLLPVLALIGGTAAGTFLAPETQSKQEHKTEQDGSEAHSESTAHGETSAHGESSHETTAGHGESESSNKAAWFSFPNQFFVPIVRNGNIDRIMVLTLTVETTTSAKAEIETRQHRLRDALLRSLMIHANTGGFIGNYTTEAKLNKLRESLLAAAVKAGGPAVHNVLIEDIAQTGS